MLHRTVWSAPSAVRKRKLVLDQEQENYLITDSFIKACERLAPKKLATAVFVESRAQNQASCPLKINRPAGLGPKPVQNQKSILVSIEKV